MKNSILFILILIPYIYLGQCSQPNYCNRSCWDPNGTHPAQTNPTPTNVTHIIVHHSGDEEVFPPNTDYAQIVRYYWDYHVNSRGWSDIGYNWLIDRNGVIYEGRGDGILGAHFSGMNGGTMGVVLIGNFILETPSSSAINSLESLIAWEATDKNIEVTASSYHSSSGLTLNNLSGHLDSGNGTECPGTSLYSLLPSIRSDVSNLPCYSGSSPNYPDIVIEEMWTEPANPILGENVDLFVKIKNVGNQNANSIYLDYKINNSIIGSDSHAFLEPGQTQIEFYENYNFNSYGNFNYCVYIDAVSNEQNTANNSYCINVNVNDSGGSEDIFLTNVSVSPSIINAGNDVTAYATMNYSGNQLNSALPSFNLDYYLSTDCSLSNDDIYLNSSYSGLGSDNPNIDEIEDLEIPYNTTTGYYYIIFKADSENELAESNENNNIQCFQIYVNGFEGQSDIFLTNISIDPTSVIAGEIITVYATMNYSGNQSDFVLPNFNLNYYLSTDCSLDNEDIYLGYNTSGLGSDDPFNNETKNLTIPNNIAVGTYYILFFADAEFELDESNENNNIECIQLNVTNEIEEDIFISNYSVEPGNINAGTDILAHVTINYAGNQNSGFIPGVYLAYYLSADVFIDNDDTFLGSEFVDLGPNNPSEAESEILSIPSTITSGTYYILFLADATNQFDEINESNNFGAVQVTINNETGGNDDVYFSNYSINPVNVMPGDQITAYSTVYFYGDELASEIPNIGLEYYLSQDCTLSDNDLFLQSEFLNLGSDNVSLSQEKILNIPENLVDGSYFILFVLDKYHILPEINENNNVVCVELGINGNLGVDDISAINEVNIYPNPSSNIINIDWPENIIKRLELFNSNGQVVKVKNQDNLNIMDISDLQAGVYLLKIINSEDEIVNFKIIKN